MLTTINLFLAMLGILDPVLDGPRLGFFLREVSAHPSNEADTKMEADLFLFLVLHVLVCHIPSAEHSRTQR